MPARRSACCSCLGTRGNTPQSGPWPKWRIRSAYPEAHGPWLSRDFTVGPRERLTPCLTAVCSWRSRSILMRSPWTGGPAIWSGSTALSWRRSWSCAAMTAASLPSCGASPIPDRWPTPAATALTSVSSRSSGSCRPSRSLSGSRWRWASSVSAWPSSRSASASVRTWSPEPTSSSGTTSCASRWSRSARSSARMTPRSSMSTERRLGKPACPRRCASRPRKSWAAWSGWASSPLSQA